MKWVTSYLAVIVLICLGFGVWKYADYTGCTTVVTRINTPAPVTTSSSFVNNQDQEILSLKREIAALKQEVSTLQSQMQHFSSNRKTANAIVHQDHKEDESPVNTTAEEQLFAKQGQFLETAFKQQSVDQQWATDTKNLIIAGLAKDKISQSAIIDLDCRNRSCRLTLAHDKQQQAPELQHFINYTADVLPNVVISQTESDNESTVFYLSRDEFQFPRD